MLNQLPALSLSFRWLRTGPRSISPATQPGRAIRMISPATPRVSSVSPVFSLTNGFAVIFRTPSGVIMGRPEGQQDWLAPGDVLDVTVPEIGTLTVTVSD